MIRKPILLLTALTLLFSLPVFAQNEDMGDSQILLSDSTVVNGQSLNITHQTLNQVKFYSGSGGFGYHNIIQSDRSYAFGDSNYVGQSLTNVFVVGSSDTVSASHTFCFGRNNMVSAPYSFCFGRSNTVSGGGSYALGRYLMLSNSAPAVVIGEGLSEDDPLVNTASDCLQVGFLSTKPTLTVTKANNDIREHIVDRTGRVAIGDVTPAAKLHIKSDAGEEAGLILESRNPQSNGAFIRLRDNSHRISVSHTGAMLITAETSSLGITSDNFSVSGSQMTLGGSTDPRFLMTAQSTPALYSNVRLSHGRSYRVAEGPSYALEFQQDYLLLRAARYQTPVGSEITNWINALKVGTDGIVTLFGKVGVNVDNNTQDYALAVNGGVIANKVFVQSPDDWPDYVFSPGYERMPLGDLETYLEAHRHLPDVPSASEMQERGVDLGGMQATLLRKIEELTLYTLEQQALIEELRRQSERQQRQIDALLSGDTVRFTYDACGNRTGRTLEFGRMDGDGVPGEPDDTGSPVQWAAELHDTFLGGGVSLFPNPTEGRFTLSVAGELSGKATATLLTLTGAVLSERTVAGASEEFDLGAQPAGIYLLRLSTDRESRTWKIVKRN